MIRSKRSYTTKARKNIDLVETAVTADMFGGPNPYLDNEEEQEVEDERPKAHLVLLRIQQKLKNLSLRQNL